MSYDYTRRTTTTSNRNGRRPIYAPPRAPASNRRHSVLGYWVPLIVTGTIALGGLAAWIWSERRDHDEEDDDYPHDKPSRPPPPGPGGPYPTQGSQPYPGPPPPPGSGPSMPPYQGPLPSQNAGPQGMPAPVGGEAASYYGSSQVPTQNRETEQHEESSTWYGQVRGVMRRTPSPQQFFDHASKTVGAGIAAAGSALGSIMEEDRDAQTYTDDRRERRERREDREGFSDHERWSEEADEQQRVSGVEMESGRRADVAREQGKGRVKKMVAVVVSADTNMDGKMDEEDVTIHASILSHLPAAHDPSTADLFVLIYAPGLKALPPLDYKPTTTSSALGSSYSQISTPAITPGSELQDPTHPTTTASSSSDFPSPSTTFDLLWQQALDLVSAPSHILPFTTVDGYVHVLRHLGPQMVYVSDVLAGDEGASIAQLKGWVGHTVLVVGDDGTGGLADTETEDEAGEGETRRWYDHSSLVGLGKPMELVDAARVGEDWSRRVGGRE